MNLSLSEEQLIIKSSAEKFFSENLSFEKRSKVLEEKNLNTVILLNPLNEEATFNLAKLRLKESDFTGSKKLIDRLINFCDKYCEKSKEIKIEVEKSLKK